jgi:hypothetical protein
MIDRISKKEAQNRFLKAKALVDNGMSITDALAECKISKSVWYYRLATNKSQSVIQKKKNKLKPKFIDIAPNQTIENVAVVVCSPSQLKNVLAGLQ